MECSAISENIPARISSIIIPKPPDTFLSNQLIGQGFKISNILNKIKPIKRFTQLKLTPIMVIKRPANSSHTIPG